MDCRRQDQSQRSSKKASTGCSLLYPYCVTQGPSNCRGQKVVVNHILTNHQMRAPEAIGMEREIFEKLKEVSTHCGAGRGNISGLQGLRDKVEDVG